MADRLRLDDQLCFALYAATNAVTRAYRPLLRSIGLTYPQYLVMLALWQDGGRPVHAIAERLALPPNAITPIVDRLEAAGLVARSRDTTDRRVVHVGLTTLGTSLEQAAHVAQRMVECRTGLAPDALAAMREELMALASRMEAAPATDESRPEGHGPRHLEPTPA